MAGCRCLKHMLRNKLTNECVEKVNCPRFPFADFRKFAKENPSIENQDPTNIRVPFADFRRFAKEDPIIENQNATNITSNVQNSTREGKAMSMFEILSGRLRSYYLQNQLINDFDNT